MTDTHVLPDGFRAAGIHCGLKGDGALDLGLIVADEAMPAFAMFTQNELLGAHIPVCHKHLSQSGGKVRAVLVNSGNANCATGEPGEKDNEAVCRALAMVIQCPQKEILFMSTGVIGARLDVDKVVRALPDLHGAVRIDGVSEFAEAILTTDTKTKIASGSLTSTDGVAVQVCGVAKGSGMIHPDMATMLAFLITDGRSQTDPGLGLRALADRSFHCVTVDGDTSPNDTVVLWTANRHWCRPVKDEHGMADVHPLDDELTRVSQDLSRQIAADGEGATRLVTIQIEGAMSEADALDAGRFVATSPLVKTAVFGRDPNWGRILSAAASSGLPINMKNVGIRIGDAVLYAEGTPHPENEPAARSHMEASEEVRIGINLGMGPYTAEVWTCDLTDAYIRINADYRT
jgi:glutamate N-acetyltransferase / amino-acid N-acetyltransferase